MSKHNHGRTAASVLEQVMPIKEETVPVVETVAPVVETVAPVAETVAPVVETVAPVVETVVETTEPQSDIQEELVPVAEPQPDFQEELEAIMESQMTSNSANEEPIKESVQTEEEKAEENRLNALPERFRAKSPDGKFLDPVIEKLWNTPGMEDIIQLHIANILALESKEVIIKKQEGIIQKPSLLLKFQEAVKLQAPVWAEELAKANQLTLSDLEGKRLEITFQGGKCVGELRTLGVTKEVRGTSGSSKRGAPPESLGMVLDTSSGITYDSANQMALSLKIRRVGDNFKEAFASALRYDSLAYLKPDGQPVLVPNGSPDKEKDYIRTEKAAAESGISLVGCTAAGKRYHPFYYELKDDGSTIMKDGVQKKLLKAVRHDRPVDAVGNIIVVAGK